MKFCTLICTYDRPGLLRRSLQALSMETEEPPDKVVIVNGGDARADDVVSCFSKRGAAEVKLVKTVNKNLAASRNVGLPYCTGDIIAMTDDDAEVFPNWVTQMKHAHAEHPEAGAVGGPVIGTDTTSLVSKVSDTITFPRWREPRYVRTLPGVNISYKREAIAPIGPQDETLFRGEDVDYNWRVQQNGYKIYYDPSIRVYHHHRASIRGLLDQHYMYGRAYYLVRRKWPEMYCLYPHRFDRPKSFLKAVNFVASMFYQPFLDNHMFSNWRNYLRALPLLFAAGVAWRAGVLVQKTRESL